MASEEAKAVRQSDLYEYQGIAKPLLTMIAQLIIPLAEEGTSGVPQVGSRSTSGPNEGWCIATQNYLAASLGCSEDNVQEWVKVFIRDGWLEKETRRDAAGHKRNRYKLTDLENIKARAMLRRENNHAFIRGKRPKMANKRSFNHRGTTEVPPQNHLLTHGKSNPTRQSTAWPSGDLPGGLPEDCREATRRQTESLPADCRNMLLDVSFDVSPDVRADITPRPLVEKENSKSKSNSPAAAKPVAKSKSPSPVQQEKINVPPPAPDPVCSVHGQGIFTGFRAGCRECLELI